MKQSLAEPLTEAAQAALKGDHLKLNRVAWNLPRVPAETASHGVYRDGLDWDRFRDLYYPDSRRHNLKAIVAYGAYKRSPLAGPQPASKVSDVKGDAISPDAVALEEWEDEGGA